MELRGVKSGSLEEVLFRWWDFIWWSIPYQRSYGRQMRFLLWDTTHDAPFGLIGLQSPVLKMSVRDNSLGIPNDELDIWVNRSMNAQRVKEKIRKYPHLKQSYDEFFEFLSNKGALG